MDEDLVPGKPYRVRARVPLAHVRAVRGAHGAEGQKVLLRDLEHRFAVAGFVPLAVLEDPTDPQLFHAVARLTERACDPSCAVESGLAIVGWEPVDEPPEESSSTTSGLDPGLSEDEVSAVRSALAHDTNPRHLYGLSDTLAPFFPVASSIVRAKATLLETQAARNARDLLAANQAAAESAIEAAGDAYDVEPEVVRAWLFKLRPDPVHDLIGVLREAGAAWPDVEEALRTIRVEKAPWAPKQLLEMLAAPPVAAAKDQSFPPHAISPSPSSLRAALERYAVQTQVEGKSLPLSVARDECRRVACDLISGRAQDVGSAPRPIQDVGRALVSELGYGVLVVRLPKLVELLPPSSNDGFVSPTALQLALGASKPIFSRALHPERIGARLATLDRALPKDAQQRLQALNMMERAERALERRRWVEWYRRVGW